MERRKEKPKLSNKRRESTDLFTDESTPLPQLSASTRPISTPVRTTIPSEDEDSPYFPCSTQEMCEDVDVLWDYASPQSKPKTSIKRKSRKKLVLQHSPKVPFRRHPSNNNEQIKQDFNKLREELRALKAEIAKPDHEESLVLSPREEEAFRKEENEAHMNLHNFEHNVSEEQLPDDEDDFQDPFDDDMDEKLIIFSQQIENGIHKTVNRLSVQNLNIEGCKKGSSSSTVQTNGNTSESFAINLNLDADQPWNKNQSSLHNAPKVKINNSDNKPTVIKGEYENYRSVMLQKKTEPKLRFQSSCRTNAKNQQVTTLQDSDVFNDSFDNVLSQMNDEDLDQLTQVLDIKQYKKGNNDYKVDKKSKVFPRSQSEDFVIKETVQMTSGKVEWHRTQSFESYNAQLSKEKLQEIERKRMEAKAKREAKKKQDVVPIITEISDSPIKCSPDEIEKKRLQALEKLEAKRLQDIIEKKKQEALKRREENRKKNAANVKSSLTTRL